MIPAKLYLIIDEFWIRAFYKARAIPPAVDAAWTARSFDGTVLFGSLNNLNTQMMTTREVAEKLVAFCRKADWAGAHKTLYAAEAESTEPYETPEFPKQVQGLDAIREKGERFDALVETIHGIEASDPLVAGNAIAFTLEMDMTIKGKGRMKSPELCVYQVKNGKIVSEEFFV